ncbi:MULTISPECIES: thioesterase II family protein [unclassified Nocardiopsis]|uniref:thioesterase II family protein n=1 Tax=Nocardiopsis TaxID=2013 RepID=UPI00387B0612
MSAHGVVHASPLVRVRPVGSPVARVFLFHHAGGAHTAFRGWGRRFPEGWEVYSVESPGRGHLAEEPFATAMDPLVGRITAAVAPLSDVPVGLFGHSMGAAVAYETARSLAASGAARAVWLGMSGHPAPVADVPDARLDRLSSHELRARVGALGGLPDAITADDALWSLFEPRLRADLSLVRAWRAQGPPAPQPVPLTLFAGEDDPVAGPGHVAGWAGLAQRPRGLRVFPGGHFYPAGNRERIIAAITGEVAAAAGREAVR